MVATTSKYKKKNKGMSISAKEIEIYFANISKSEKKTKAFLAAIGVVRVPQVSKSLKRNKLAPENRSRCKIVPSSPLRIKTATKKTIAAK